MLKNSLTLRQAELVVAVLSDVLGNGATLDRAYARQFSEVRLAPSEQANITFVTGDLMRRLNLYTLLAGVSMDEAAVAGWSLICVWHQFYNLPLPPCPAASLFNLKSYESRKANARGLPALWDGCPEWLDALGEEQLGDAWAAERRALTQHPKRFLRVNTLKCDQNALTQRLLDERVNVRPVSGIANALEVLNDAALFRTDSFQEGWFEQQDAGSQQIAEFLDVQPGMRVIDACAGAGGKTLHLAALMQGKGRLLALDIEQWKLENLKQRARRAGAHNVETRLITSSKTIKRLKESADRLLLDVPCSGLGVLKRNPDAKWRDTAERLPILVALQADILNRYSKMVKPGGTLVYATCSILPCENQDQVAKFLGEHQGTFTLVRERIISPAQSGFDGFYMALIRREAAPGTETAEQSDAVLDTEMATDSEAVTDIETATTDETVAVLEKATANEAVAEFDLTTDTEHA
jgi:16S rRNA (cytosine967-C5)-methyltransferase